MSDQAHLTTKKRLTDKAYAELKQKNPVAYESAVKHATAFRHNYHLTLKQAAELESAFVSMALEAMAYA